MENKNLINVPAEYESETFLLSRMLSSVNSVNDAIAGLQIEDFSDPVHRVIFSTMRLLYANDEVIEPVSVVVRMQKEFPDFEKDSKRVFSLHSMKYGDSNDVSVLIKNIKEASKLKKLIFIGTELTKKASEKGAKSNEVYGEIIKKIELIFSEDYEQRSKTLKEIKDSEYCGSGMSFIPYLEQKMEDRRNGLNVLKGMPTGFLRFDKLLNGLCKGHYIIFGGRPGVGKTTLALNVMYNLMMKNIPVGMFSLEMSAWEVYLKIAGIHSQLDIVNAESRDVKPPEFQEINAAVNELCKHFLTVDDQESLYVSHLIARAKRMIAVYDVKLIVIDYLGEIRGDGKFSSKQDEIQSVSKQLRGLAKKTGVPIICICQLNRNVEQANRPPIKSDLRDSGQIEADAHSIILLHKSEPKTDFKTGKDIYTKYEEGEDIYTPGVVSAHIVKNRFGKEGRIDFTYKGDIGLFTEQVFRLEGY